MSIAHNEKIESAYYVNARFLQGIVVPKMKCKQEQENWLNFTMIAFRVNNSCFMTWKKICENLCL